ncbi:MAG: DUF2807 domain-containing protein [Bacteroidota bacterium]
MKTSIKILWVGLILMVVSGLIFLTFVRLDLKEIVPQDGNGVVIEKTIPMEKFSGFTARNGIVVHYLPAEEYAVKIKTDSNLFQHMRHNLFNGDWMHVTTTPEFGKPTQLDVTVYAPRIKGFEATHSAEIICDSTFEQTSLEVRTHNSGKASFFAITENLKIRAHNSSYILAKGQTEDLDLVSQSSSEVDASGLFAQYAEVSANRSGEARVNVEHRLVANCSGGSQVVYIGPENLDVKARGQGIRRAEN